MLHLTPAPLHRFVLRHGYRARRLWWRWRRPILLGVAVVAQNTRGEVLLVRLSYGPKVWSLPAGGRSRGEEPERAARREFREELGARLGPLTLLDTTFEPLHGAADKVHVFAGEIEGEVCADGREVIEARFFALDDLPQPIDRRVAGRLALLGD